MKIYRPVSVPDLAYIREAALWLAFGRVPEYFSSEDGMDQRSVEVNEGTGIMFNSDFAGYLREEFASLGIDVDYDRYWDAVMMYGRISGAEYLAGREEWLARGTAESAAISDDNHGEWVLEEMRATYREGALEADWALSCDEPLDAVFNKALTVVIGALQHGLIPAWGSVDQDVSNLGEDLGSETRSYVRIPAEHWASHMFNPTEGTLKTRTVTYKAVHVCTLDLLTAFPEPMCQVQQVQGRSYPSCVIIESGPGVDKVETTRRGRKPAGHDLSARKLIRNAFLGKYLECEKGGGKKDAVIAEAIDFSERVIGKRIARSTIQSYFKDEAE